MKYENAQRSEQDNTEQEASPLAKLAEFCCSYTATEVDDLFCRMFTALIGGHYRSLNNITRERLLNYMEALENLLPVIHEIHRRTAVLQKLEEAGSYDNYIAFRRLFAAFKSPPE